MNNGPQHFDGGDAFGNRGHDFTSKRGDFASDPRSRRNPRSHAGL